METSIVSLLRAYNIFGHVDGTLPCSVSSEFSISDKDSIGPTTAKDSMLAALSWKSQDQFILHAIVTLIDGTMLPLVGEVSTSAVAWARVHQLFANSSRSRVLQLKSQLSHCQKGEQSMIDYLHAVKSLADELTLVDNPISSDDLTLYILDGLSEDYTGIVGSISTREHAFSFEELKDILIA
ncbi:uncharacterized protein LOC120005935 [Tripterygium wilfordii]|uniref:uncharacterized protein LOC120005935 n=1 Tax=Tripterygium wilfordii TaxID=458696 RepID=UPI0018F840AF|nr:uncharacterized protein LOC120005935 [Tripterygium wilfordii]